MSIFGMIGIGVAILLALVYAFAAPVPAMPNEAQALGYRFGTILAALGFSFLIAYPIAGRRKARNPNLFAGFILRHHLIYPAGQRHEQSRFITA